MSLILNKPFCQEMKKRPILNKPFWQEIHKKWFCFIDYYLSSSHWSVICAFVFHSGGIINKIIPLETWKYFTNNNIFIIQYFGNSLQYISVLQIRVVFEYFTPSFWLNTQSFWIEGVYRYSTKLLFTSNTKI